ncbi:hypothetical protein L3Y34_006536 [Caenorhabditis briggsae]|uniref:Uncharacterized protein n=1 Tax=Caenorhabditis briggsae TaxID=6238 RepID=A0AAE9CXU3_CAEBR|nr:hypothetical protein L3Y34_006536 [Caenorhabditis briggsae]
MASYSLLLFLTLLGASTHAYMDWETGNERTNVPIWFKQEFKLEYCNNKIINGGRGYEDSPKYEVQLQRKRRALTLIEAKITNCNEIPN